MNNFKPGFSAKISYSKDTITKFRKISLEGNLGIKLSKFSCFILFLGSHHDSEIFFDMNGFSLVEIF
jgi:hypothetical protein